MKTKSRLLLPVCGMLMMFCGTSLAVRAAEIDPVNPPKSARVPTKTNATNAANGTIAQRDGRLSAGLEDVVKLTKAGVDESVVFAFIESSSVAYRPSAPEILKLRELGISSPVIGALLRRGEEVRQRAAEAQREAAARNTTPAQPPPAPAVSNPPPRQPASPPPTVINYTPVVYPATYPTVVYSSYPTYRSYPTYSYGYRNCYYPRSYYSSYSCYPRGDYYGGFYSRSSLSVGFRGGHYGGVHYRGGYSGYRHCR